MKIDFEGRTWSYDAADITVQDAEVIEKETGGSVADWLRSLTGEVHAGSYKILYWLMRSQNGDPVALSEANFRLYPFVEAVGAAVDAEVGAVAAEPDPTAPPSTPPAGSQPPVPPLSEAMAASQPG